MLAYELLPIRRVGDTRSEQFEVLDNNKGKTNKTGV